MDYEDVKLGLIGRLRVWNEKRIARSQRQQYNKDEGELLEVDYSKANQLEEELLNKKKIKLATKDAMKMYKETYGRAGDEAKKKEFLESFLTNQGLIDKRLPEPESKKSKKDQFIEQYLNRPTIYCKIGDKEYKTPYAFVEWCLDKNNGDMNVPLSQKDEKTYYIETEKLSPKDRYVMNKRLMTNMLDFIGMDMLEAGEKFAPDLPFPTLCRRAHSMDFITKKLMEEGKTEEAAGKLEELNESIFEFNIERLAEEEKRNKAQQEQTKQQPEDMER